MEHAKFCKYVPKYIDGYDIDTLYEKSGKKDALTQDETIVMLKAFKICETEMGKIVDERERKNIENMGSPSIMV